MVHLLVEYDKENNVITHGIRFSIEEISLILRGLEKA